MTVTGAAQPRADAEPGPPVRSVAFLVFTVRLTESGGVTVPGKADRAGQTPRDRAHTLLDTGADGRAQLPGTSLAGALRDMIRLGRGEDVAGDMFGRLLDPGGPGGEVAATASKVWVLGSRRIGDGSEFRSATAIDRSRAAAAANTLRTEEVLPAGSTFEVFLRWDDPAEGEVEDLAGQLAGWRSYLGRGVSYGRGAFEVEAVRHGMLRLDLPEGLLCWLTMSGPDLARAVAVTEVPAAAGPAPEPVLRVGMSIDGPWHVGSGQGADDQVIPLFRVGGEPAVPGSALKGLLRSRAEYILRSVGVSPQPCECQQCGECWPCQVFGSGGRETGTGAVGRRAVVRVLDTVVRDPVPVCRTHVAIDRFTGGALHGALYTMEALEAGTFTVQVHPLQEIPDDRLEEIRAVLRLVVEDLRDGIIGVGGGVTRGYGTVTPELNGALGLPSLPEARAVLARMAGR
jgi:CRISPR/Cas system CSM-associated protein Csm3 (group 7 of RAMP superfamily)